MSVTGWVAVVGNENACDTLRLNSEHADDGHNVSLHSSRNCRCPDDGGNRTGAGTVPGTLSRGAGWECSGHSVHVSQSRYPGPSKRGRGAQLPEAGQQTAAKLHGKIGTPNGLRLRPSSGSYRIHAKRKPWLVRQFARCILPRRAHPISGAGHTSRAAAGFNTAANSATDNLNVRGACRGRQVWTPTYAFPPPHNVRCQRNADPIARRKPSPARLSEHRRRVCSARASRPADHLGTTITRFRHRRRPRPTRH